MSHLGIMFTHKIELKNIFIEMTIEIVFIVFEPLVFGQLFHWFASISIGLLVVMGGIIYIVSLFLNLLQMKQETKEINILIKKRNKDQD